MKTLEQTPQFLIAAETQKVDPSIPKDHIRVTTVQYRSYLYHADEMTVDKTFLVHDANRREAKIIAVLALLVCEAGTG